MCSSTPQIVSEPPSYAWVPSQMSQSTPQMSLGPLPDVSGPPDVPEQPPDVLGTGPRCAWEPPNFGAGVGSGLSPVPPRAGLGRGPPGRVPRWPHPCPWRGGGGPSPFSQQEPSGRNSLQDASPRRDERVAGRREGTLPGVTTRHRSHIKGERRCRRPPAPPGGALRAPLWGRFAFTADSRTWGWGDSGRLGPSRPQIPGTSKSPESPNPRHAGHSRGDESQHGGRGVPGDGLDGRDAATAVGVPAVGVDPHQCHPLRGPLGDGPRQGQRLGVRGTNPGCPRGSGAWEDRKSVV